MTTNNSFQCFSIDKPQQIEGGFGYEYDLGNGNFLDYLSFPPMESSPVASDLLYTEYHGPIQEPLKSARKRRYTIGPSPCHNPASWPEARSHAGSYIDTECLSKLMPETGKERSDHLNVYPLKNRDINRSSDAMRGTHGENGINKFFPPVYSNFPTNFELHSYLSNCPFTFSFLCHPEILYRKGFANVYEYATNPPTSQMTIRSPLLPWPICLQQARSVIVYDVFAAIYSLLLECPTESEMQLLYSSPDSEVKYRKFMAACNKRLGRDKACQQPGESLRKIDWLSGSHVFARLVRQDDDALGPVWRLCFRRT